mmetsp:Transcript_77491/g.125707  ORF Transcript_77491/g.125707 Transcript_77491/m.125707 type:complete len:512 (-) Transcript_77491:580-2115(-)
MAVTQAAVTLALLSICSVSVDGSQQITELRSAFGNLPPATVSRFVPETSTSWRGNDALRFSSTYAQGTTVRGFLCSDFVRVGPYGSFSPFCCVTSVDGMFDGSGIAGFAPPSKKDPNSQFPPLPPLFMSLANITGQDNQKLDKPVPKPVFSFISSPEAAELQLGGYDTKAVKGKMNYVSSLSRYAYVVPVTRVKLGALEILNVKGASAGKRAEAVLDSGTSCICLPDNLMNGLVTGRKSPFDLFHDNWQHSTSAPLTITVRDGLTIEIPAKIWLPAMQQVKGCLMKDCPSDKIILGDWLFQSWLVLFDLGPTLFDKPPRLGLAARDHAYGVGNNYHLHEAPTGVTKVAMVRKAVQKKYDTPKLPGYGGNAATVPDVELSIVHDLFYLLPVMVGKPAQRFDVVFDTGSSFFGLVTAPASSAVVQQALVKLGGKHQVKMSKQLQREVDEAESVRRRLDAQNNGPLRERNFTGPGPGMVGVGVIGLVWGVLVVGAVCAVQVVRKRQRKGNGDWF